MTTDTLQKRYATDVPLKQMVTYRLSRLHAKLNAQATRILKHNGDMTLMQWRILVMLDLYGIAPMARIVRDTEFDKGLLSRAAKTLAERGLIKSEVHESDHRQQLLSMTTEGRLMFDVAVQPMRGRQNKLRNSMSNEQRDIMFDAFEKLERMIEEMETQQ
jgi:DNA-binding MarR family transcriptional regulator